MRGAVALAASMAIAACGDGGSPGPFGSTSSGGSSSGSSSSGGSSSGGSSSGGSSSGASQEPAGSPGQEEAYCEAYASHQQCNGGTATQPCRDDRKCVYGRLMSRTAANAFFACYSSPSCKSDDECNAEAGRAAVGVAAAEEYTTSCLAKRNECPDIIAGDTCSPGVLAFPNHRDLVKACLAKPCAEIAACLDAAGQQVRDCG